MQQKTEFAEELGVDSFTDGPNVNDGEDEDKEVLTVINCPILAKKYITPTHLYALNECRRLAIKDPSAITTAEYWVRYKRAKERFATLDPDTKSIWDAKSRKALLRRPHMADQIIDALRKNPKRSWLGLEDDINCWCSASTIRKWLTSRESFKYYAERIFPDLLPHQKEKHAAFAYRHRP